MNLLKNYLMHYYPSIGILSQKKMRIVVKNASVLTVKFSVMKIPQSQNCLYTPIAVVHGEKQR